MEENGYFKVLGNRRVDIMDWNDPKKERNLEIDLEENNQITIVLKCVLPKETAKQIANEYYPGVPKSKSAQSQYGVTNNTESMKWSKSLRITSQNDYQLKQNTSLNNNTKRNQSPVKKSNTSSTQASNSVRAKSPGFLTKTINEIPKPPPIQTQSVLEEYKPTLQNSNIDESEEDEYELELQKSEPMMISPRVFTPQPMKQTPESMRQELKLPLDTSNDRKQLSECQSIDDIGVASQIQNRLSNLEQMIYLQSKHQLESQMEQRNRTFTERSGLNSLQFYPGLLNQELVEDQLNQYKHTIKEIALLLDVNPDCTSIVMAVQRLVQKSRQQSEQIVKVKIFQLQCENQVLQNQLQNQTIRESLFQEKHLNMQNSIKQKLKIYQTLFEENVQLKNVLKQDLQKIINLNLELKQYKTDLNQQKEIEKEISLLNEGIKNTSRGVDQQRKESEALIEEMHQIQNMFDISLAQNNQTQIDSLLHNL